MDTRITGELTELKCQMFCLERGFIVSKPIVDNGRYDLLLDYNNKFYQSLIDDNSTVPTVGEAWKLVSDDILNYVTDQDIKKAMSQAIINANERFGSTDEERINIYLHLVAFYLVIDLKNASSGINSSYLGVIASKSVGVAQTERSFSATSCTASRLSLVST